MIEKFRSRLLEWGDYGVLKVGDNRIEKSGNMDLRTTRIVPILMVFESIERPMIRLVPTVSSRIRRKL